ncbi:ImmA/IrrE family metallo-endopeptidase [Polaromonas sp. YR568]|uniref:ImmA/IrrE family metallo-endopeptidase n=1 Tax=Polaromonas sp. YR568 TaxID=1855301 RepID=UPI00313784A5
MSKTDALLQRLGNAGFSETFVKASLPVGWIEEQDESSSSQMLARLLLARRLNLDPITLMDDGVPLGFLHSGPVKFKHLRLGPGPRREALTGFAIGVARILFSACSFSSQTGHAFSATEMRRSVLASGRDHIGFGDVLSLCWSLEIPVLHLQLFPAQTKGITAMAIRIGHRHAILVARESGPPAQYMFHVAHELGHIALGHLADSAAIIDADPNDPANDPNELVDDEEEHAADRFAQELLTGTSNFRVDRDIKAARGNANELAKLAMISARKLGIDPGHIVLSFANTTGEWALAMAAIQLIPDQEKKPSHLVNEVLWSQIESTVDEQSWAFLRAVAPP